MARKHQGEILQDAREAHERRTMGEQLADKLDELGLELPEPITIDRPDAIKVPVDDGLTDAERLIVETTKVETVLGKDATPEQKAKARILKPCKRNHGLEHWRITPKQVPYCIVCYKALRIEQAARKLETVKAELEGLRAEVEGTEEVTVE